MEPLAKQLWMWRPRTSDDGRRRSLPASDVQQQGLPQQPWPLAPSFSLGVTKGRSSTSPTIGKLVPTSISSSRLLMRAFAQEHNILVSLSDVNMGNMKKLQEEMRDIHAVVQKLENLPASVHTLNEAIAQLTTVVNALVANDHSASTSTTVTHSVANLATPETVVLSPPYPTPSTCVTRLEFPTISSKEDPLVWLHRLADGVKIPKVVRLFVAITIGVIFGVILWGKGDEILSLQIDLGEFLDLTKAIALKFQKEDWKRYPKVAAAGAHPLLSVGHSIVSALTCVFAKLKAACFLDFVSSGISGVSNNTDDILSKMISFFDFVVEKISVEAVKHNLIAMKADHIKGAVFFGKQNIESEGLRNHLSTLAKTLSKLLVADYSRWRYVAERTEEGEKEAPGSFLRRLRPATASPEVGEKKRTSTATPYRTPNGRGLPSTSTARPDRRKQSG
nr:eukaryotic translation initiation factor 3 subunit A-like [Ipomoea batatas]